MKTLDELDVAASPVNEGLVRELHEGRFLATSRNAVLIGGTGTGIDWMARLGETFGPDDDPVDPDLMAQLAPPDLRRYLTALRRGERFTEGTWAAALGRGVSDVLLAQILAFDAEGRLAIGASLLDSA